MLRTTPFHARTGPLCQPQNWRRWAGYVTAGSYELTHDREYHAIRSSAALFDISPLFKYEIRGPDAVRFLDRVVTRDVSKCQLDQVLYTPWCDEFGKVMDDGTLSRLSDDAFILTSAEPNLRWLLDNVLGFKVTVEDVSDSVAALSLQGPNARAILNSATDGAVDDVRFFRQTRALISGTDVRITRTGYTGDLGYEIWVGGAHAEPIWDGLIVAGKPYGVTPAGMLALDVARIEAGLILIDVDYVPAHRAVIEDRKSSPSELGLGWTVRLEKEAFNGRDALVEEQRRESEWQLRGLEIDWESLERVYSKVGLPPQLPSVAWRTSVPVYAGQRQVGYATSGCWSPVLKSYIALAHLCSSDLKPEMSLEMEVTVEHRRRRAEARIVDTPFFDPERKRS
ncbi:MAG: aminomethyltransferase family protein [Gemmatimonadota bacterium]|nr:aminomethyltransferase family protein [Gemmatimonadota bacterium]